MIPGTYNLTIVENSRNTLSFVISGITTTVGYSAAIDIRVGDAPNDTLLLALTSPSGGITLSSDASNLTVAVTITEAQADALAPALRGSTAWWSLKVTSPGSITTQYLLGVVNVVRTPTA